VSQALTLWALVLCFLGIRRFLFGAGPIGLADPFQHDLFDSLPGWSNYIYVIAAGFGLMGGLALLNRAVAARWLFLLALGAFIVRFGWLFVGTSLLRAGGPVAILLPLVIVAVGVASVKFSHKAWRHGWIC
jgi:hypothetical protein